MLPVFLSWFSGRLCLLDWLLWKVLIGSGLWLDKFCVGNCSPLIGPSCSLVLVVNSTECCPFFSLWSLWRRLGFGFGLLARSSWLRVLLGQVLGDEWSSFKLPLLVAGFLSGPQQNKMLPALFLLFPFLSIWFLFFFFFFFFCSFFFCFFFFVA